MIVTDILLKKIEPSKGMRLTDGEVIAEKEVYLAKGSNGDNWYEISEEEAERILLERRATNELLSNSC